MKLVLGVPTLSAPASWFVPGASDCVALPEALRLGVAVLDCDAELEREREAARAGDARGVAVVRLPVLLARGLARRLAEGVAGTDRGARVALRDGPCDALPVDVRGWDGDGLGSCVCEPDALALAVSEPDWEPLGVPDVVPEEDGAWVTEGVPEADAVALRVPVGVRACVVDGVRVELSDDAMEGVCDADDPCEPL